MVYPLDSMGVVLWCIHNTRMPRLSTLGSIRSSSGIVGSLYIMVTALKCVMTCEYGNEPSWGLRLWYQFGFVVTSIVVVSGLFLAANLVQWRFVGFVFSMRVGISAPYPCMLECCSY